MKTFAAILICLGAVLLVLHLVQSDGPDALNQRGHEALKAGDYRRAIDLYSQAIAESARTRDAVAMDEMYASRGRAYLKVRDFRAAQADLSIAIELKPAAAYYFERSLARQGLREVAGAVTDLRSAIELDARHAEAHLRLCLLLVGQEGGEAALPICLQTAQLGQPVSGAAKAELEATLRRLAEAAYSHGRYEEFLRRYRDFAILSPQAAADALSKSRLAQSHYQLGERLLRGGSPDAAVEHYRAAIDFDPKDLYRRRAVTALVTSAEKSEAEGRYERAVTSYERALELAGGARSEIEVRLADARRLERCYSLKSSGDAALRRIDWALVEKANEIIGPFNRGIRPTQDEAFYIYSNAEELTESVSALVTANQAYRNLMGAGCPSELTDDALRANVDLILSWAAKANEITEFLVNSMKNSRALG